MRLPAVQKTILTKSFEPGSFRYPGQLEHIQMFILQHKTAQKRSKKNVTKGGLGCYRVYDDSSLLPMSVISCCGGGCCLFS